VIQMNSMLSSETNPFAAGQHSSPALNQARLDSFHGALSDAVSSTLEKFGIHPNEVKISITRSSAAATPPATSASSDTLSSAGPSSSGSAPATNSFEQAFATLETAASAPSSESTAAVSTSAVSTAAVSTASVPSSTPAVAVDAQQDFDDFYWASQPPAVQALQNIKDPEQRAAMATQLANEGYSIDVPIMVWGWDPSITTAMRQADGYTWVPSALQNPVEVAPGLGSMGTMAAYNPNNPPAGSIAV
jgi:hypothetical protein